MWELDNKKRLSTKELISSNCGSKRVQERPLDCKEIKSVTPKGNQSWIFIGRTDAEIPIFWPPDVKSQLFGKDSNWRQEKGTTEDGMVGWHHWLNGHEFEETPGDSEEQGSLVCFSPWDCRVGHNWVTEQQVYIPHTQSGAWHTNAKLKKHYPCLQRTLETNLLSCWKEEGSTLS